MGNDCLRLIAGLFLATSLIGCLDGASDIDIVKEGRFDAHPEFKIGETFDNRSMCESTSWQMVQDNRGRDLVEYRCEIVGVNDYYHKRLVALAEKCEESLNDTSPNPFRARLKKERQEELDSIDHLKSEVESAESDRTKRLIKYHSKKADEKTARLEELDRWEKNKIANNKTTLSKVNQILSGFNVASAYEFFRWSVAENGTFVMIEGGVGLKKPTDEKHHESTYGDRQMRLSVGYAYENRDLRHAFTGTHDSSLELHCQ